MASIKCVFLFYMQKVCDVIDTVSDVISVANLGEFHFREVPRWSVATEPGRVQGGAGPPP